MKKLLTLLLIACSVITTVSAQQKGKADNTPYNVKALFNTFLKSWGAPSDEVYSVNKNPNTNQIESSVKITHFVANVTTGSVRQDMSAIGEAFKKDESRSYQLLHLAPTNKESFSLKVVTENGQSTNYLIRAKEPEEMWLLCAKNTENPKLRDAYAIKWTYNDDRSKALGAIYQITSLRPDYFEQSMSGGTGIFNNSQPTTAKTFKIEGRVDANIKDSLYNIYIANSAEELENIGDDDYVACVPVINKRFEWQTELDHPVVGRLRCIFPDGSLCSAWINLDFVPGETYRITVHNGYYDEDRDYERRVGRNSGKSLLNRQQSLGIDDIKNLDKVVIDNKSAENVHHASEFKPTTEQEAKIKMMGTAIEAQMKGMIAIYESLKPFLDMRSLEGSDNYFKQIIKLNKEVDGNFQELIKYMSSIEASPEEQASKREGMQAIYSAILEFYTKQNKGYAELYKKVGVLPKSAKTAQEYINKLTEKYIKEIGKL